MKDLEDLGAPPRTPALLRDAAAAHLVGHHKGYQPPRTGTRSFGRRALPLAPARGGWPVWRLPDEEIRLASGLSCFRCSFKMFRRHPSYVQDRVLLEEPFVELAHVIEVRLRDLP